MASLQGILVHGIVDSLPMASIWVIPPKSITSAVPHRAVQEAWRAKRLSGYGWCYFRMPRAVWFTDNLQELEDQQSWPRKQFGSWSHEYKSWENHGIYSVYAPGKNLASVPEADMRAFRALPWTWCWSKLWSGAGAGEAHRKLHVPWGIPLHLKQKLKQASTVVTGSFTAQLRAARSYMDFHHLMPPSAAGRFSACPRAAAEPCQTASCLQHAWTQPHTLCADGERMLVYLRHWSLALESNLL